MVRIAGQVTALSAVRRNPTRFAGVFSAARSEDGCAYCLCRTPPLRLVIRARAGRFHLAGWPDEGSQHAFGCAFHKLEGDLSGRPSRSMSGILQTPDGTAILLHVPLTIDTSGEAAPATPPLLPAESAGPVSRHPVGLLGLMHFLWEEAQLNQWNRGAGHSRSWHTCRGRLLGLLDDCTVNAVPLDEALYVVPPFRPSTAAAHDAALEWFCQRLGQHQGKTQRGLMLGEVKEIRTSPHGHRIALRHLDRGLFTTSRQLERWRRSYVPTFASAAGDTARRIGLLVVEPSRSGSVLKAVEAAFMLTNTNYIPVESSYELRMADALAAAGRRMIKPLRWDRSDELFPDFVLTDTEPPTYVEVYGVKGRASYDIRKRIKQATYVQQGRSVIEWEIGHPMPCVRRVPRPAA
ncbi:DUF1173 family protein [Streptomyces sp. NPDC059994]|uniref:DUF1173 family protein n=1 Tax=Streptomyces sp. NPDC059994 TaxID=3347029 RepID=UPI0036A1E852